jgi:hypothetical protein
MTWSHGWHAAEDFGDVFTFLGEGLGPSGPLGVVAEQVAVLLHGRAAAGCVDDDGVDVGGFEERDEIAGHGGSLIFEAGMDQEGSAAGLTGRGDDVEAFGAQDSGGGGVDVGEEDLLDAAGKHADTASLFFGGCIDLRGHGPCEVCGHIGEESFHGGETPGEEVEDT